MRNAAIKPKYTNWFRHPENSFNKYNN